MLLHLLRSRAYAKGKRPEPGSLLYSPSLALRYAWADLGLFSFQKREEDGSVTTVTARRADPPLDQGGRLAAWQSDARDVPPVPLPGTKAGGIADTIRHTRAHCVQNYCAYDCRTFCFSKRDIEQAEAEEEAGEQDYQARAQAYEDIEAEAAEEDSRGTAGDQARVRSQGAGDEGSQAR